MTISRDRARRIAGRVEAWFAANARVFPWRPVGDAARDGYVSLVSEIMLQQTQAARVAERLPRFLARFPTVGALAAAGEDEVLHEWEGLGYYRRARLLHAAAVDIRERFGGDVPSDVGSLRSLPGVGEYTAGAIASMAFGARDACVDGNIQRVLMRVEGIDFEQGAPETRREVWDAARTLVSACGDPAAFNEGVMELGATICTPPPTKPDCARCPVARLCVAKREGRQDEIPRPKKRVAAKVIHQHAVVIVDARKRLRVSQRPDAGLWRKMWEPITLEADEARSREDIAAWAGVRSIEAKGGFEHKTTHRVVRVTVWAASGAGRRTPGVWADGELLGTLAMSNAARRSLETAGVSV